MIIDYQVIKKDLLTDKGAFFIQEFPEAKEVIERYKEKPTCGSCEQNVLPKLMANPRVVEKLKLIYGNDIQVDLKIPERPQYDQTGKTFFIKYDEYDKWFEEFSKQTNNIIRFYNTCYIPHTNTILVSVIMMVERPKAPPAPVTTPATTV